LRDVKRIAPFAAALALAAAVPAAASAYWQYYGWLPNGYDRDCLWYATSAQCSGWNYWSANEVTVYSGGPTLNGFENYATIRGHYTYAGQFNSIGPWDLGMPRYVRAQETNFATTAWASVWAVS
jgi:hypothetical protein